MWVTVAAALPLTAPAVAQAPASAPLVFTVEGNPYARSARDNPVTIQSAAPDGSARAVLIRVPAGQSARRPRVSPNGTKLAYVRVRCEACRRGPRTEIRVADADGGAQRTVARTRRVVSALAWTPSGRSLLYAASRPPRVRKGARQSFANDVYRVATATGRITPLTQTPAINEYDPTPGPGGRILFGRNAGGATRGDLWLMGADGSGAHALEREAGTAIAPSLSPDQQRIVFAESPDDSFRATALSIMNADGSGRRALTSPARGRLDFSPAWSPDNSQIAFVSSGSGRRGRGGKPLSDVFVIHAAGGVPVLAIALPGAAHVRDVDWLTSLTSG